MVKRQSQQSPKLWASLLKIGQVFVVLLVSLAVLTAGLIVVFVLIEVPLETKNVVFVSAKKSGGESPIVMASIDSQTQKVLVVSFAGNLVGEVIGDYGNYPINSVRYLLQIGKKDEVFLRAAYSHIFQKSITEVNEVEQTTVINQKWQLIELLAKNRQTWPSAFRLSKLDEANFVFRQVGEWEEWEKVQEKQLLTKINDQCSVAIVNASQINGLASRLSKILENSGVEVVRTTDSIWDEPKTALYVSPAEAAKCQEVIAAIQAVSPVILPQQLDQAKSTQYRARIIFFIGNELADLINLEK